MLLKKLIWVVLKIITCGLLDMLNERRGGEDNGKETENGSAPK